MYLVELFQTADAMHGTLSNHYTSAANDSHADAYINGRSKSINGRFLGKGGIWNRGRDQRTTEGLLAMINAAPPLDQPIRVFSNTTSWNAIADIQNTTLVTKPFTSTSLDYDFVFRFGWGKKNQFHTILQFDLPEGYHQGVYIGHHASASGNQKEFLLAPNQTWNVVGQKVVNVGNTPFTIVELTPR